MDDVTKHGKQSDESQISTSDKDRLEQSRLAEAESEEVDDVNRAEDLRRVGDPLDTQGAAGLPGDQGEALDENLLNDPE